MSEMVSAEEARTLLDGGYPCGLGEAVAAGRDILTNAAVSGRYGVAVRCAADVLCDVERLARTVIAMHAIIEGRTEPPTPAELAAHDRAGGRWIVLRAGRIELPVDGYDARMTTPFPSRWWSLASDGRPCAGPVVTP